MISSSRIKFIKSFIDELHAAIDSGDKGAEYDAISKAKSLFGSIKPEIYDCYEEAINYNGTTTRNIKIIISLLEEYLLREQETAGVYESTAQILGSYPTVKKLYMEGISKYEAGIFERNTLDDMRAALETLIKVLVSNDKTLENNISEIGSNLKDKSATNEFRNMFTVLVNYYAKYNNNYIKHNDKVNLNEIEYVLEFTSITMKLIIKLLGH